MRRFLIAGNWKMNKLPSEAAELAQGIVKAAEGYEAAEWLICPPFTALDRVAEALSGSSVKLGAQNMHTQASGAFTGEISAAMLKDLGASYVILGHSERRELFGETDAFICEKVHAALGADLTPVFCVGETLEQREAGQAFDVIAEQVANGLKGLDCAAAQKCVLAYEPVWAIGTGKTATPEQAEEVHAFIRGELEKHFDRESAQSIRILYGGSMKPSNAEGLLAQPNIDGGLIGGASLQAEDFAGIARAACQLA